MISLDIDALQVKKWTATQKNWSLWSMFMAVSNFAAAPTGGSLITRFFKQPPGITKSQQNQEASTHEDLLLQGPGLPERALSSERQQGTALAVEPSAQCGSTEQDTAAMSNDRHLKSVSSNAADDEQPSKDRSPQMASPSKALTSEPAIGLQGNAPAGVSALPLSARGINAQQNQATAFQRQPSALLHATAGLASPQKAIQPGEDMAIPSSPCSTPATSDDNDQRHEDGSAAVAACREDTSGASDQPVQAQAGQSDSCRGHSEAHGPAHQGAAKRPLEQAFAKEPEHRKKPTRCGRVLLTCIHGAILYKTCSAEKHYRHSLRVSSADTAFL